LQHNNGPVLNGRSFHGRRETLSANDRALLKSAQNDLDVLENVLASMADSVTVSAIVSLIHEVRILIGMLQSDY
jgi:hypothetical protein